MCFLSYSLLLEKNEPFADGTITADSSPDSTQTMEDSRSLSAGYLHSIDSLMLSAVRSYSDTSSLIHNSRVIKDHSVLEIVGQVASVYDKLPGEHKTDDQVNTFCINVK